MAARKAVGSANPLRLTVSSDIPIGKGLGSSAAAFAAGVAASLRAVEGEVSPDHVYRVASELEGHPDNVAAAVYGGLVLVPAEGMPIRIPLHPSINVVVGVPDTQLSTAAARASVATEFSRDVVVRSLSRISALTAGLMSADPQILAAAHGDEIHEAPRSMLSPEVDLAIRRVKNAGAWHAARSGAGPAVIALTGSDGFSSVCDAFRASSLNVHEVGVATTGLILGERRRPRTSPRSSVD
jgi:homoserine kinase